MACGKLGLLYSLGIVVVICFLGGPLTRLFLDSRDVEAIATIVPMARRFLLRKSLLFTLLLFVNLLRFTIQGLGFSALAVVAGGLEMIARGVFGMIFVPLYGFEAVCFADPAAWLMADLFLFPAYFLCLKKRGYTIGKP